MADKYKTLPIGTIFTYNGNKYKVCEDTGFNYICSICAFKEINCDTIKHIRGNCGLSSRTDHNSVYYKQINETMKKDSGNIVCPTFKTNDSLNDLHVECPKGYSIDIEHSDLSKGIIKFKNDNITYIDIEDALNLEKDRTAIAVNVYNVSKLNAIDKLINIANYYNKGWKPNWNNSVENKYFIVFDCNKNCYSIGYKYETNSGNIFFKNKVDIQAVIDNPNFKDILDAIYKD
nr:MAG TPA: hypothetical protein [Crassvirales sp.]